MRVQRKVTLNNLFTFEELEEAKAQTEEVAREESTMFSDNLMGFTHEAYPDKDEETITREIAAALSVEVQDGDSLESIRVSM